MLPKESGAFALDRGPSYLKDLRIKNDLDNQSGIHDAMQPA